MHKNIKFETPYSIVTMIGKIKINLHHPLSNSFPISQLDGNLAKIKFVEGCQ
jgi:hypothetical protein